jgi:hypothetical protein
MTSHQITFAQELTDNALRRVQDILDHLALVDPDRERPELHNRTEQILTDLSNLADELCR